MTWFWARLALAVYAAGLFTVHDWRRGGVTWETFWWIVMVWTFYAGYEVYARRRGWRP